MKDTKPALGNVTPLSGVLAVPMLAFLTLPFLGLLFASSVPDIIEGFRHRLFWPALRLSLGTSLISLGFVVVLGTPLAWWLAHVSVSKRRMLNAWVDLPMLLPPSVIGLGLLLSFGRHGLLGETLIAFGIHIPLSTSAVVIAQIVVSSPFYIQSAATAFGRIHPDQILVAQTLGQNLRGTLWRVVLPLSMPGLVTGAALCWARALGEFGATLLFAGNMPGVTQTMPLAIYTAMESDLNLAQALALLLTGTGLVALLLLRQMPGFWQNEKPQGKGSKS
jgi:molybdate transport system permease protein